MSESTPPAAPAALHSALPGRLDSLDTYRGFVMFLMMAEVLHLGAMARSFPESGFWRFLARHQSHVEWVGCSLHDLIQPSFSFIAGVALPFSIAARRRKGDSVRRILAHALWRSLLLVLLGVFLRSTGSKQTRWTFEDTLSQIGLGYAFLTLLGFCTRKVQIGALAGLLLGYWAAFALYPLPGPDFDWKAAGASPDWIGNATGFAAHWNKNTNFAWAFDTWFMNLFPRERPFLYNGGGYSTLSFIPTLGTMILGLLAGEILARNLPRAALAGRFAAIGGALLFSGWLLGALGLCPVVKRIWTPSWVLFSGGWCFLLAAGFHAAAGSSPPPRWAFPLRVIGLNSIAAYCAAHLFEDFFRENLKTHLGQDFFQLFGKPYEPLFAGAAVLTGYWLLLFWMHRRKLYLKI